MGVLLSVQVAPSLILHRGKRMQMEPQARTTIAATVCCRKETHCLQVDCARHCSVETLNLPGA